MSTQGGGAIVGLAIGCIALPAVLAVGAVVVAGRATVLAARGAVHIGKALHSAYQEHEKTVEERLAKEEATSERLAGLHRALSAADQQIEKCSRDEQPQGWGEVEFQRYRVRELSRRKQKLQQEKATAAGLQEDLERTFEKLERVNDQLPSGLARASQEEDLTQRIRERSSKLESRSSDIAARLEEYREIGERVADESRIRILQKARELLEARVMPQQLVSRLGDLETNGSLDECEGFLREIYAARREPVDADAAGRGFELSRELAAARLTAESLPAVAMQERRALLSGLDAADLDLDDNNLRQAAERLKLIEHSMAEYAGRDLDEWVKRKDEAEKALRTARVVVVAMEEDEGMLALLSEAGTANQLGHLRSRLDGADRMIEIGSFETATSTAKSIAERAESLRDETLHNENERRLGAIVSVIQQAMERRGFESTQIARSNEGQKITARRGETEFWIAVSKDGNFLFDLGKDGFSSQAECWEEINGLLEDLKNLGIVLDVDLQEPTLEPVEGTGVDKDTARWRTNIYEETPQDSRVVEKDREQEQE